MNKMPLILCAMLSALCLFASGCCSAYKVSQYNNRVEVARMVRLQANNNGAMLGVDLLNLNAGYFAAWADDPAGMSAATLGDAALGFIGYKFYEKISDNSSSGSQDFNTAGGDIYYIQGDGNNVERTRSQENNYAK